jgi:ketosteroid isomerase-like protein
MMYRLVPRGEGTLVGVAAVRTAAFKASAVRVAIALAALAWLLGALAPATSPGLRAQAGAGESAAGDVSGPSRTATLASAARDVRRVFNLLVAAANRLDADAEGAFFWRSPELISVAQGTATLGWEEREAHTRQWYGALETQRIEPGQVEVRPLAPDVVSLMATMRQEIRAKDGRSWKGEGVWSLVFRRLKGDWKVVYEHYSYEK